MNWVRIRDTQSRERERKRLIRKPDQVGPGLPLIGSICYEWSCRGGCSAMEMAVTWPWFVPNLREVVAGREGGPVPFLLCSAGAHLVGEAEVDRAS